MGALSSCLDYGLFTVLSVVLGVLPPVAAIVGVGTGASVSFALNRRFAFADSGLRTAASVVRYALGFGALMILHATTVGVLTARFGLPPVPAKMVADVTLLAGGQLLLLRYVVFPRNKARPAAEVAGESAQAL